MEHGKAEVPDMLKRKIYDELLAWKEKKSKECLLVQGARQVGKTFIIQEFGKKTYASYIYLNFYQNPEHKRIFDGSLEAVEIYKKISIYVKDVRFVEQDTLISASNEPSGHACMDIWRLPRGSHTPLLCSVASLMPRCLQRGC
jgi:hypothetical protein